MLTKQSLLPALNHLLTDSGWALPRLAPHAGRSVSVALPLIGTLTFCIADDGRLLASETSSPDLTFSLPTSALLSFGGDRERLLGAAQMQGNVEFAETLGFVLRHLQWDVEDDLSRLTGDVPARRLVEAGRRLRSGVLDTARRLGANLAESSAVIGQDELRGLGEAIASLARRTDKLAERLDALARGE